MNDHYKFRSNCTLADDFTPRKYLAGRIQLFDGKEAMFIEVVREKLSLSTLMLVSNTAQNWGLVCHQIIKGLIKDPVSWPDIEAFDFHGLNTYRFKHTNVDAGKKEKKIFSVLV